MKLTEYLAIYAAGLSTIVFAWNVVRTVPKYRVDIVLGTHGSSDDMDHGIYIRIVNPSQHTVHLSAIDILYRYKETSIFEKLLHFAKHRRWSITAGWVHASLSSFNLMDGLPLALESGMSHNVFVPNKVLEQLLSDGVDRFIRAGVQNQICNNKYSKKFEYPKDGVVKRQV